MNDNWMDGYQESMFLDSQQAPGGVIVYDSKTDKIVHANHYVLELCECDSAEEFMRFTQGKFHNFIHEEDAVGVEDSIQGQIEKRGYEHIYYRVRTKSGTQVNVEEYGRLEQSVRDRSLLIAFIVRASSGDFVDWLTGLPSMYRFHELARNGADFITKRGQQVAAISLDLANMKSFNTRFGRDEGDRLLRAFADVLRKYFGSEASSRFAEDHFYAFAANEGIKAKLEGLFEDFKHANDGNVLPVRVGVYVCDPDDDIVAVGFDRAKAACDLDRATWHSHITWYNIDLKKADSLRMHILGSVEQALSEGWIRPYYQPIRRSTTGDICREEALARWIDPELGPLSPGQFIPVLEEAGLLHRLDMHIVDCVLADMAKKYEQGVPVVPVSVNISLRDLEDVDVAAELTIKTDAAGVSHDLICVEFTESAASEVPELFRQQVNALRACGFKVWMDDFGSGYSSLNTLQNFDFDLIKLDMAFISKIEDKKARDIIAGVVKIARNMGMSTLAEGVETEQQALYLEKIGCDMLQGFYYVAPQPLEVVVERYKRLGNQRESLDESLYWKEIGFFDLSDPTANLGGYSVDGSAVSEFPSGVMELRDGEWSFVRANESFRVFLDRVGLLSRSHSDLMVNGVEGALTKEFFDSVDRAVESHAWERIGGRLEYGTGFQFYMKLIATATNTQAFAISSVPTMLGTALGSYGDVPVAYSVYRVKLYDAGEEVTDLEFVYANNVYYDWVGLEPGSLTGRLFMEAIDQADPMWFSYCYRAAVLGETIHDIVYSRELNHWLSFSVAPSPVKDCCVYAFMLADKEQKEREEIEVGRDTADFVIEIANVFNEEDDYDIAMNKALEMMSEVIHPERLYVFERHEKTTDNTFEWCAEGVEPMIDTLQGLDNSEFDTWGKLLAEEPVVIIPDVEEFKDSDPQMYATLRRQGITHTLAVPFMDGDKLIGYLGADNYAFDERLDTTRLLEGVSSFMGSRISSHRVLVELERKGTHDVLTGLLNRRGVDNAIAEHLAEHEGEPFTLALMDIDNFKLINDIHGHGVGDEALREISRTITETFPDNAILGRNGGDEFLVMLFGDRAKDSAEMLDKFSKAKLECEYEGQQYKFSMSIGYADYPEQTDTLRKAYTLADTALYAVKLAGKAGARRYSQDLEGQYRMQQGFTPHDIAENAPGAVVVHKAGGEGDILFANNEVIDLFECESLADFMEHTGGTFKGIVHPDDQNRVFEELTKLDLDEVGEMNFSDYRVLTKAGNIKNIADNGRLVKLEDTGKVFYVLMMDRDERGESQSDGDSPEGESENEDEA